MKEFSIKSEYFNAELIIQKKTAILKFNDQFYSSADISQISPKGCHPWDIVDFEIQEWNLVKILAAIVTIKNDLCWEEQKGYNKVSSYTLKHIVECQLFYKKATEILGEPHNNLGNGELIVAMLLLRFKMRKPETINTCFNLDRRTKLDYYRS
jgi:hypothetical protein